MAQKDGVAWDYVLSSVTEDKHTHRVGVLPGRAYDLIGVDGSVEGGQRPFPGFLRIHTFDPRNEVNNPWTFNGVLNGSAAPTSHPWAFTVQPTAPSGYYVSQIWPVQFRISNSDFAYGFVYRVKLTYGLSPGTGDGVKDGLHIDYRIGTGTTTYTRELQRDIDTAVQTDVAVYGRFVYLAIEGQYPVLFFVNKSGSDYQEVCVGGVGTGNTTGPGSAPTLIPHSKTPGYTSGSVASPSGSAPANGQVVITATGPGSIGTGGGSGNYPGAAPQTNNGVQLLSPGDYNFAFQLFNSTTGRKSALSEIAPIQTADFASTSRYAKIELVYDSTLYDQAIMYRSVRTQDASGTLGAVIIQTDAIITLATYALGSDPGGNYDRALYYYVLQDKALATKTTYLDRPAFDTKPPTAGAIHSYENTMLYGNILKASGDTEQTGLGEIRWSSLTDRSPELVAPSNIWIPDQIGSNTIRFETLGENVVGFSRERLAHGRKESVYLKWQPMHPGFGIVAPRAAANLGPYAWYCTAKGIKAIAARGEFDNVGAIDKLVISDWASTLSSVVMAYDPHMSAVFIVNTSLEKAAVFWLNTDKVTEIYDVPFVSVEKGWWPLTPGSVYNGVTNPLVQRAMFLQRFGSGATGVYRLFVVDAARSRTAAGSSVSAENTGTRNTLMDVGNGNVFLTYASNSTVTTPSAEAGKPVVLFSGTPTLPTRVEGAKLYVLTGTAKGRSWGIRGISTDPTNGLILESGASFTGLAAGDILGVSPVYFRWTGSPLWTFDEVGRPIDQLDAFKTRLVDAVGLSLTDVSGAGSGTTQAQFEASVYKGNSDTVYATAQPVDLSGNAVSSITDGQGVYYAGFGEADSVLGGKFGVAGAVLTPSVAIYCPDLDYRLVAVRVMGNIQEITRNERPS